MRIICAVLLMAVAGPVGAAVAGGGAQALQPAVPAAPAGGGVAAPLAGGTPAPQIGEAVRSPESPDPPVSSGGGVSAPPPTQEVAAPPPAPEPDVREPAGAALPSEPVDSKPAARTEAADPSPTAMALSEADVAAATAAPLAPMGRLAQDGRRGRGQDRPGVDVEVPVPEDDPAQVEPFVAESPDGLPRTGQDMSVPATGGIAMLAAGLALLALTRRRLHAH